MKAYVQICTQIFITALLVITPNYKQPTCLSTGKKTNKIYYYTAKKKGTSDKCNKVGESQNNYVERKKEK